MDKDELIQVLRAALFETEWGTDIGTCTVCGGDVGNGHRPECPVRVAVEAWNVTYPDDPW